MVALETLGLSLGAQAPGFVLRDSQGSIVSLSDFKDAAALLVVFIRSGSSQAEYILSVLAELFHWYQLKGLAVVGVIQNGFGGFTKQGRENIAGVGEKTGVTFPCLFDENNQIAEAYCANGLLEFFLFDNEKRLVYRGRMDHSQPGNNIPLTGLEMIQAIDSVFLGSAPLRSK